MKNMTVSPKRTMRARVVQALMGHSNFSTTTKYFRLTDQTKAREYYAAMELAYTPEA